MTSDGIDKPTDKRPNYFAGQYLLEDDFQAEQQYHIDRQRWHHHLLHISGIAEGLKVTKGEGDLGVNVSEGSAIDPQGRQITLLNLKKQDLKEIFIPKNTSVSDGTYTLYIGHSERKTDQQTLGEGNEITSRRWQEEPEFRLSSSEVKDFIPLAKLTIDQGVVVSDNKIYNSVRVYSGLRLPSFDGEITLRSQSDGSKSVAELKGSLSITDTLSVTGNVGIGTTSPKIHLAIGDDSTGLKQQGNGQLAIYTNLHERVRIDENGRVGIGTTTPTAKLEVSNGNLKVGGNISATNATLTGNVGIGTTTPSEKLDVSGKIKATGLSVTGNVGIGIGTTTPTIHLAIGDNETGLKQQGEGQLAIYTNSQERVRINATGNVGIGTTTPTEKLEISGGNLKVSGGNLKVNGDISANNATLTGNVGIGTATPNARLDIDTGKTEKLALALRSSGVSWGSGLQLINTSTDEEHSGKTYGIYSSYNGYLHFTANDVDRLVVDPAGNVGIGTTAPGAKLEVKGSTNNDKAAGLNVIDINSTSLLYVRNDGNVGIGTAEPSAQLNVNPKGPGGIVIGNHNTKSGGYTSLELSISAEKSGHGEIQVTHSSGNLYGDLILNPKGGNVSKVGIGTTSPTKKLEVVGGLRIVDPNNSSNYLDIEFESGKNTIVFYNQKGQGFFLNSDSGELSKTNIARGDL